MEWNFEKFETLGENMWWDFRDRDDKNMNQKKGCFIETKVRNFYRCWIWRRKSYETFQQQDTEEEEGEGEEGEQE